MFINAEHITNIVIYSVEKPVKYALFAAFLDKSPFVKQIAFIGKAIFDMPEFSAMVKLCAEKDIVLIFGEAKSTSAENLTALVKYGNVLAVNIPEHDPAVDELLKLKQMYNSGLPEVNLIVELPPSAPQNSISKTSYAFYNLADDIENIGCLKLLSEPMLNYDGVLLGCWQTPKSNHTVNAFKLGIEEAVNHPVYKKRLKMLRTGRVNMSCPCARCPVFLSLIWTNKTIDVHDLVLEHQG